LHSKFFGAKNAPAQQTKLSFSTKPKKEEVKQEEDVDTKVQSSPGSDKGDGGLTREIPTTS
jgi:DNA ligase-1